MRRRTNGWCRSSGDRPGAWRYSPRRVSCSPGASIARSASTRSSVISAASMSVSASRRGAGVAVVVEQVAVERAQRPERKVVARVERLADHGHVAARVAVETGAVIGIREAPIGQRADRHRRPSVRPHRQRTVRVDRRLRERAGRVDHVHLAAPHAAERPLAHAGGRAVEQRNQATGRACGDAASRRTRRTASRAGRRWS